MTVNQLIRLAIWDIASLTRVHPIEHDLNDSLTAAGQLYMRQYDFQKFYDWFVRRERLSQFLLRDLKECTTLEELLMLVIKKGGFPNFAEADLPSNFEPAKSAVVQAWRIAI